MFSKLIILAIAAALPFSVVAQDPVVQQPNAVRDASTLPTAIVPFGTLPTCAQVCGPLFDAQGACTPPVTSSVDTSCFCKYSTLQAFYQGAAGVCSATASGACTGSDLLTVRNWFVGLCGSGSATTTTGTGTATATGTKTSSTGTSTGTSVPASGSTSSSGGGTWLDNHWKYVVMLVVIVVGIVVIWVAACLFRRRHLRKKELQYELRPPAVPWAENQLKAGPPYGFSEGAVAHGGLKGKDPVRFGSTPGEMETEKASRKKWIVKERT